MPALKKQNGKLARLRERLYRLVTLFLSECYRYYAVEDTIVLNDGQVKVEHSIRDVEFERELERLGIFVEGKRLRIDTECTFARRGRRCLWGFFHFEDIVTIAVGAGKRTITIKRGEVVQATSTIRGAATKSSDDALISRLVFGLTHPFASTTTKRVTKRTKTGSKPAFQPIDGADEGLDIQQPAQPQVDNKPARTKRGRPPKSNIEPPRKPIFEPLPSEVEPGPTTPTVEVPVEPVSEPIPPKKYIGLDEVDESF